MEQDARGLPVAIVEAEDEEEEGYSEDRLVKKERNGR